jgi:peptidoglycan biosynthesis protein MviN/MurJ (putative lipid II flippase)
VRTWIGFLLILGFVSFVAIPREHVSDGTGREIELAYSLYGGLLPLVLTALLTSSLPSNGDPRREFAIGAASLVVMLMVPLVGLVSRDHPFLLLGAGGSVLVLILDTMRTISSPRWEVRSHHLEVRLGYLSLAALGACLALWWGAAGAVDADAVVIFSVTYAGFYGVAWWVNTPVGPGQSRRGNGDGVGLD